MQFFQTMRNLSLSILCVIALAGCASTSDKIPADQLNKYALIELERPRPGSDDANFFNTMDAEEFGNFAWLREKNVLPGIHNFKVIVRCGTNSPCVYNAYTLQVEAGLRYVVHVDRDQIDVSDRNNEAEKVLRTLFKLNGEFVTREVRDAYYSEIQKKEAAAKAIAQAIVTERRKQNLPLVRKIGARICQEQVQERVGYIYRGYVESLAADKVQIRIAESFLKSLPSMQQRGFTPSVIWDSPMNWDICE